MDNNKEYILNIRVSKDTYKKLKDRARENGETLSNLVRKTLDDSYEILGDLKREIFGESVKSSGNIAYYQKVILAQDAVCDRCRVVVPKGETAFLGETKSGAKKYFCGNCFSGN